MPGSCDAPMVFDTKQITNTNITISDCRWLFQQDPLIILITLDSSSIQSGLSWVMELLETSTFHHEYLRLWMKVWEREEKLEKYFSHSQARLIF